MGGLTRTSFKKGHIKAKTSGAVKGQQYSGVAVKKRILNWIGGQNLEDMLVELYHENKNKFWDVAVKMLPNNIELTGGDDEDRPLRLIIKGISDRNKGHCDTGSSSS